MKKAFFINGGSGRVLCALPALEYYVKNISQDIIVVAEGWFELFSLSPVLRDKTYPINNKNLFNNQLLDREIISPEPYRLNAYFTQRANLIQAFDILINDLKSIPDPKPLNIELGKGDQAFGYNFVEQVKYQLNKEKTVVFQPFGSGAKLQGRFVIDESGRSFEYNDVIRIVEELGKHYAVILFTDLKLPIDKQMPAVIPDNLNLLQWMGLIKASDYFLGCDSVGQHFANALGKSATVVIGSTYPENISYPYNKNFTIIDNGGTKRKYSPIRIAMDWFIDRDNEELMVLDDKAFDKIIKSVTNKLGKSSSKSNKIVVPNNISTTAACNHQPTTNVLSAEIKDMFNKQTLAG
jgi:hypothetical protein